MTHNSSYDWRVLELLPKGKTILEIGSGYGNWGLSIKSRGISERITGIEPFKPYWDKLIRYNIYENVYNNKVSELPLGFIKKDVVLCCDVIEHIEKSEAKEFIERLESWADELIIITTPNGNSKNDLTQDGNELNRHRSYYNKKFFTDKGFKVEIVQYDRPPKIFRPFIRIYNYFREHRNITSQIIAIKKSDRWFK